jgi:hypothetical protein
MDFLELSKRIQRETIQQWLADLIPKDQKKEFILGIIKNEMEIRKEEEAKREASSDGKKVAEQN